MTDFKVSLLDDLFRLGVSFLWVFMSNSSVQLVSGPVLFGVRTLLVCLFLFTICGLHRLFYFENLTGFSILFLSDFLPDKLLHEF